MLKKFAEELKEERIKCEISLQQISAKSRIDIKYLEAIENGDFDVLPDVYLKAFLKDYASNIGLDGNLVMKKFNAAKAGKQFEEKSAQTPDKPSETRKVTDDTKAPVLQKETVKYQTKKEPEYNKHIPDDGYSGEENLHDRVLKNNIIVIAIGVAVIAIAALVYFLVIQKNSIEIITEKPYEEVLSDNKERFETEDSSKTQTQQPVSAKDDSLDLVIKTTGRTWIKVIPDDMKGGFEFILDENSVKTVKAKKYFKVILGNSGNAAISLEGRDLGFEGISGRSRAISIDSAGTIKYLKSAAKKKTDTENAERKTEN